MSKYDKTPVPGYRAGRILTDEKPVQVRTPNPDGKASPLYDVVNDWFEIDGQYFNVHPYRSDLEGYPVRWIEQSAPEGWT